MGSDDCGGCWGTGFSSDVPLHRLQYKPKTTRPQMDLFQAMETAVQAVNKHKQKRERTNVSNIIKTDRLSSAPLAEKFGFTESQLDLIKRTVAKNATDDELELFFYRCKILQLNPLMPGQIFFIKYGNSAGSIVIGIDGFRARAHATGKLTGTERGALRDDLGDCIGAWAKVYRTDWVKPAHEEVSLNEYNTGKGNWAKMPETMIKKVAEVAALRIAFPNELGGLYIREEMDQAEKREKEVFQDHVETPRTPSDAQFKRLFAIANKAMVDHDQVKDYIKREFNKTSSRDLTLEEYNQLCNALLSGSFPQSTEVKAEPSAPVPTMDEPETASLEQEEPMSNEVPWAKYRV